MRKYRPELVRHYPEVTSVVGSVAVFDFVAQDESGSGIASLGGGEVLAGLVDGRRGPCRGEWVQAGGQVSEVGGVDVAAAGGRLPDQYVGFVAGSGVAGVWSLFLGRGSWRC